MRKPRKHDRLIYTGPYAKGCTARYGPGTVVGFRNYGQTVTVELDDKFEGQTVYADWPVSEVAPAP